MDEIAERIEHTVLGPTTTWDDVSAMLDEALRYGMRVCVPPCYVAGAVDYAPGMDLTTVVGFPHGQHATATKCTEAHAAWEDGAEEIDLVPNHGLLRSGDVDAYRAEIAEVVAAVPGPLKVILETALLSEDERDRACQAAAEADATFLKTSTGFADGGATVEDVSAMAEYLPVKASGGIGSWSAAEQFFEAGADRIGASSGDVIVEEFREEAGETQ